MLLATGAATLSMTATRACKSLRKKFRFDPNKPPGVNTLKGLILTLQKSPPITQ